jgi:hypothetical protein
MQSLLHNKIYASDEPHVMRVNAILAGSSIKNHVFEPELFDCGLAVIN